MIMILRLREKTGVSNPSHPRRIAYPALPAALSLCALVGWAVPQFAQELSCPESISVKQNIEKIPEGWSARPGDSPNLLEGVTFFSGPPEEQASLAYDNWTRRKGLAYAGWHFPKSMPRIWLSCRYSSTSLVLARQLAAETSQCTVTYDPTVQVAGSPSIRKIDCH